MNASKRVVHIVGTGTIGEPLIGLFCAFKDAWGIDEVTFHKRTPLLDEAGKVDALIGRGAKLVVDEERVEAFEKLGHKVSHTAQDGLARSEVVIDCTPVGNQNKPRYVDLQGPKRYLAQGSEYGFGHPYARGINDETLPADERFVQIVSCNTHNICVLLKLLGGMTERATQEDAGVSAARFLCLRRAADISQADDFIPAPEVGLHKDARFGTHHARDAWHVFNTQGYDLQLFSSAVKLPTQYMHVLHFSIDLTQPVTHAEAVARLSADDRVALTEKLSSARVFSFGRDQGFFGRILNQTVVPPRAMHVSDDGKTVTGFCFTPQDGNSLLSSVASSLWALHGEDPKTRLEVLRRYMFARI